MFWYVLLEKHEFQVQGNLSSSYLYEYMVGMSFYFNKSWELTLQRQLQQPLYTSDSKVDNLYPWVCTSLIIYN